MKVTTRKAALERKLSLIEKELEGIKRSAAFKKENAISRSLNNLMKKHGCTKNDLISILKGNSESPAKRAAITSSKTTKPRKLKIFKNPHTNEVVRTRGGNQSTLKQWKVDYELEDINEWLISTEP